MSLSCPNCGTEAVERDKGWLCPECKAQPFERGHWVWAVPVSQEVRENADPDKELRAWECAVCGLEAEGSVLEAGRTLDETPCNGGDGR